MSSKKIWSKDRFWESRSLHSPRATLQPVQSEDAPGGSKVFTGQECFCLQWKHIHDKQKEIHDWQKNMYLIYMTWYCRHITWSWGQSSSPVERSTPVTMSWSCLVRSVHIWSYPVISGHIWSYLIISNHIWSYPVNSGQLWSNLIIPGHSWSYQKQIHHKM